MFEEGIFVPFDFILYSEIRWIMDMLYYWTGYIVLQSVFLLFVFYFRLCHLSLLRLCRVVRLQAYAASIFHFVYLFEVLLVMALKIFVQQSVAFVKAVSTIIGSNTWREPSNKTNTYGNIMKSILYSSNAFLFFSTEFYFLFNHFVGWF